MAHPESSTSNTSVLPGSNTAQAQTMGIKTSPSIAANETSSQPRTAPRKKRNDVLMRSLCEVLKRRASLDEVQTLLKRYRDLDLNVPRSEASDVGGLLGDLEPELPLHMARYNVQVMELLLENGASPESFCGHGLNALQCSAIVGLISEDLLNCLTKGFKRNAARETFMNSLDRRRGWRVTHYVADFPIEDSKKADAITKAGADWTLKTAKDQEGGEYTPFELAVKRDNWDIARYLANMQWRSEGINCKYLAEVNTCGCLWIKVHVQNTAYIQRVVGILVANSDRRARLLDYITPKFRYNRDPRDPVGGSGRDSVFTLKALKDPDMDIIPIVIPYFSTETTGVIKDRTKMFRADIEGYKYTSDDNFNYLGLQCVSTLDEYCHQNLDKTMLGDRNIDQVFSRHQYDITEDDRRILVVPQLWIWAMGSEFILTALQKKIWKIFEGYTHRESDVFNYLPTILDKKNPNDIFSDTYTALQLPLEEQKRQKEAFSRDISIAMLLSMCVDTLDSLSLPDPVLPVSFFTIFERSISKLHAEVRNYTKSNTLSNNDLDIEKKHILEIADVREELSMVKIVISQQEQVWRRFMNSKFPKWLPKHPEDDFVIKTNCQDDTCILEIAEILARPQKQLADYKRQIAKLDADAERVQESIKLLLDLKSKHAGLKEAHLTTLMSAAVIGFTIITIIFTPLAFLASIFALSTDKSQNNQQNSTLANGAPFYDSSYIGKWMVTIEIVSLFVTALAIWLAFKLTTNFEKIQGFWNNTKTLLRASQQTVAQDPSTTDLPPMVRDSTGLQPGVDPKLQPEDIQKSGYWNKLRARRRGQQQQNAESGAEA